ncbi:hypothetical protein FB567DRAFT_523573 [Paraphoma chrysanthemicola]|uniref:Uncharacterized protein n=1 Tax=Paraphoma chrysanthemicola TaxID=798071 RepID=A0A8K0R8L8_9PLEO|nr:hypothetical protein FB567DRAFT_523573 [Paraphoma chrysanthemicola]
METLDRKSTRAPEEQSATDSHSAHPNHGAIDAPKEATFPLMRLPVELRLMVYEYAVCEIRRRLPIPGVDIYLRDIDVTLLQVSRSIQKEIGPSLKRRRLLISPCLTFNLESFIQPRKMSNALFLLPHIIRMLAEERCTDHRQNGPEVAISEQLPDVGMDGFVRRLRPTVWKTDFATIDQISNHPHFQNFYRRTTRQLRTTPTIVIRFLLNREAAMLNLVTVVHHHYWEDLYKSTHDKFPSNLKLRIVFVALPDYAEDFNWLLEEAGVLHPSFTRQMWSVEVSRGGLDPAVD